ncbi:MAG: dihydroorotate dehydrogenase electron transfer subunit [Firmicutes bacterium]|nr:dihydroorotate dehydrogenase electron transfer subunit [Bacillota bacterium]
MATVEVVEQMAVGDGLFSLRFRSPVDLRLAGAYHPGQFLHIRVSDSFDFLLRRPLSLCKADVSRNELTVIYRAQGEGTKRLSRVRAGDQLDVLGPLGRGFPIHDGDRHALLVAGGIGVPPMLELAHALKARGQQVTAVLGFQNARHVILQEELMAYGTVHIASDDGTVGTKGLVTDLLTDALCTGVNRYYACGPTPMLRAVQAAMQGCSVPGYLSLEERMGCGIGICVGCVHPIRRGGDVKQVKTCKEGPVFSSEEVVFT